MMEPMDPRSQQSAFTIDPSLSQARTVSILSQSMLQTPLSLTDPMHTSPSTAMMGPPSRTSPDSDANGNHEQAMQGERQSDGSMAEPNAATAAAASGGGQQPKVVQTAFIHKLYNMLEDESIRHLISWSTSGDSFVMSPSNGFSKVLSQYFKHTNISSFVRQLNMYGFHKVSDVFHTGSPESPFWEFKHGAGNFRRGDMIGLREIKRRASRHALVHRETYPASKPPASQPGTPAEPMPVHPMQSMQNMQSIQESTESRLASLEHALFDMHARLSRSEENTQYLQMKNQIVMETLSRSFQSNQEISRTMLSLVPNPDNPMYRDIINMQADMQRQSEMIRSMEEPTEPSFSASKPYFSVSNLSLDNPPISPRQIPQDGRTASLSVPRHNYHRPPVPSQISINSRRGYGSIGSNSGTSPNSLRPQVPPPPPIPHPLASVSSSLANVPRRHTSADIRNVPGWQANHSPFGSGNSSSQWPSSPRMNPLGGEDQHIRDSFSLYSLTTASSGERSSRPTTPPFSNGSSLDNLSSWTWGPSRDKNPTGMLKDSSGPPTRRGSMAHILNPAETAEGAEEHEEEARDEDRKRKRLQ